MVRRWLFLTLLLVFAATQAIGARRLAAAQPEETPGPLEAVPNECIVALADDGQTINLRVGDHLILALGKSHSWTVVTPSPEILKGIPNVLTQIGCQGRYVAREAGHTQLIAMGEPPCPQSELTGGASLRQFVVNVVVQ
jgi:hypothetical protein